MSSVYGVVVKGQTKPLIFEECDHHGYPFQISTWPTKRDCVKWLRGYGYQITRDGNVRGVSKRPASLVKFDLFPAPGSKNFFRFP